MSQTVAKLLEQQRDESICVVRAVVPQQLQAAAVALLERPRGGVGVAEPGVTHKHTPLARHASQRAVPGLPCSSGSTVLGVRGRQGGHGGYACNTRVQHLLGLAWPQLLQPI